MENLMWPIFWVCVSVFFGRLWYKTTKKKKKETYLRELKTSSIIGLMRDIMIADQDILDKGAESEYIKFNDDGEWFIDPKIRNKFTLLQNLCRDNGLRVPNNFSEVINIGVK